MNTFLNVILIFALMGGLFRFIDEVFDTINKLLLYARRRSFLSLVALELESRGVVIEFKKVVKGEMLLRVNHHSLDKARPIQIPATFELSQVNHARFADYLIAQTGIDVDAPAPVAEAEA